MTRHISGAAKARPAIEQPGRTPSWWLRPKGGSSACWCASYEGWRFLEADKCATFPFWTFGTILPGCSGATTAAKLMLATLLETVATRLPTYRLWNVVDDISGHVAGSPKMVQVLTAEAGRLLVEGLKARDLPLSEGKSKVLIDDPDKLMHALLQQLEALGIDESVSARNVGADLQLGRRRRALVVKGRLARATKRTKRVRQLRKAGAHTGKLTLTGSNAGALGFRGFGFHSNTAPIHQSRRGQSHISAQPRAKCSHNGAGQRPSSGGQKYRPSLSTSPTGHPGLGDRSLGRHASRHHAGRAAWLFGQAQPSQTAVVRSYGRRGHFRAHASAPGLECAVCEAPYNTRRNQDRPLGCGAQDGGLLGRPGIPPVVGQLCTLLAKGPLFWDAIRPLLVSGKLEGWSLWHRNVLVKLVSRGIWTQERLARLRGEVDGSCQLCNDGPGTMFHRCYECLALQTERDMYVSQEVRAAARAVDSQKGNSLHTASFRTLAPSSQPVSLNASARFSGTIGLQTGSWRGTFSRTALPRAAVRCDGLAGLWWRSTMWETSRRQRLEQSQATFCLGSRPEMAKITQRPWGSSHWIRSRFTSTAKAPLRQSMSQNTKLWVPEAPEHTSGTGFCYPTTRSRRSRSRVIRHSAMWRRGKLPTCAKRETTLQTPSHKKEQTHTSLLFEPPRLSLPVLPWPSKLLVGRPKRMFCSGSGGGTTPWLPRHVHGYGPRVRDSSGRQRRRLLRRLQARFLTGFLPCFPLGSRKTVTSTLVRSEGTACNWDESSMREAELWTTPSSSAGNAANSQGAGCRSYAN